MKQEQMNAEIDVAINLIKKVNEKLVEEKDKDLLESAIHALEKVLGATDSLLLLEFSPKIHNIIYKSGVSTYSKFKTMEKSSILALPRLTDDEKEFILVKQAEVNI